MTPKQERFVQEYLLDLNATQAAVRAGYSEATAHSAGPRLLANVEVANAIAAGQEKRAAKVEVDQEWVLGRLVENIERAMQTQAVVDREGKETGEYRYEGSVANKALELVGKHVGMFVDRSKLELTGANDGPVEIADRSAALVDVLAVLKAAGIDDDGGGASGGEVADAS